MDKIKRFLYGIRNETTEIRDVQNRISALEAQASGLKGIAYDGVKVQTSPQDSMIEYVAALEGYRRQLVDKGTRLLDKRRRAQDMIDKLSDPLERQVLELYFLSDDDIRMSEVADCVHYSERWTWSIYKMALYHLHQCTSVTFSDTV